MFKEAIILNAFLVFCVNSQTYPNQNCPVFQYDTQNGVTVGRVELPNDFSGDYRISINMTAAVYLTQSNDITIQRQTEISDIRKGFPLVYFIIFPVHNVLLKPTRIEFNGQVYCSGPQESLTGQGITNFWATNYLGTGGSISRPPPGQPPIINRTPPPFYPTYPVVTPPNPTYPVVTPPRRIPTYPVVTPPRRIPTLSVVTQTSSMRPTPSVMPYSSECGLDPQNRSPSMPLIAEGLPVVEKQYPWMAALMYQDKTTNGHTYHCTGSLVTKKHVITAAHCVQVKKSPLVQKEEILIIFGLVDIGAWLTDSDVTIAKVSDISVHPDFNSTSGDSDVAVLTLTKEIKFTPYLRPICIWNEDEDLKLVEGELGIAAGWGSDKSGNDKIEIAKFVDMPIVSQVTCLRSNPKFRRETSSRTFCAGKKDGSGPCNGDSGGPFMLKRSNRWTLRGVVSRSLSDDENQCDVYNYFIFADIAKSRSWLDGVLI